jgi:hypothetical protein
MPTCIGIKHNLNDLVFKNIIKLQMEFLYRRNPYRISNMFMLWWKCRTWILFCHIDRCSYNIIMFQPYSLFDRLLSCTPLCSFTCFSCLCCYLFLNVYMFCDVYLVGLSFTVGIFSHPLPFFNPLPFSPLRPLSL